jgi:hypothetical protein
MILTHLSDQALLASARELAQTERETLTKILHHLREIERRRLYCDAGCASLFEYVVKCLHYSEGQAGRRIQAMRLIKEIPEIEQKIESGALSLSNISQAQSFFRDISAGNKSGEPKIVTRETKLRVLERLENKSSREGQKELIQFGGDHSLPREHERVLTDDKSEIKFVMNRELREKLDVVRSLLGPDAASMNFAELITKIADIGAEALKAKKFGKRRAEAMNAQASDNAPEEVKSPATSTPAPELRQPSNNPRYISKDIKSLVWQRDRGVCRGCGSRQGLNFDHIVPVARGGTGTPDNLRLLCFACNQRAGIKSGLIAHSR